MTTSLRNRVRIRTLLGELLRTNGVIDDRQLQSALERQKRTRAFLGEVLLEMGYVSPTDLGPYVEKAIGFPFITLADYPINLQVARSVPPTFSNRHILIAFGARDRAIQVAFADPLNVSVVDKLQALLECPIVPFLAFEADIIGAINRVYDVWNTMSALRGAQGSTHKTKTSYIGV